MKKKSIPKTCAVAQNLQNVWNSQNRSASRKFWWQMKQIAGDHLTTPFDLSLPISHKDSDSIDLPLRKELGT